MSWRKWSLRLLLRRAMKITPVIEISNPTDETAFFIRLKIMNAKNELVLPSFFTDNYFTLLPGDEKQIGLDLTESNNQSSQDELKLVIEGWNMLPVEIKF